jgi:hypothetical protein
MAHGTFGIATFVNPVSSCPLRGIQIEVEGSKNKNRIYEHQSVTFQTSSGNRMRGGRRELQPVGDVLTWAYAGQKHKESVCVTRDSTTDGQTQIQKTRDRFSGDLRHQSSAEA